MRSFVRKMLGKPAWKGEGYCKRCNQYVPRRDKLGRFA